MRNLYQRLALLALLTSAGAGVAQAQTIYKFVGADGVVEYSTSRPPVGTSILSEIDAKNVTPAQRDALERQRLANAASGADVDAQVRARIKRLNDADNAVTAANLELQRAEQALQRGREPLPGERRGTVSGYSRLTDVYWQRIAGLEKAVDDARRKLDQAYLARAGL